MSTYDPKLLLHAHGLEPKKSWGQNFLRDEATLERIVDLIEGAASKKRAVLEIGPGTGALTGALLRRGFKVLAVERDADLIPILRNRFEDVDGFDLVHGDALKIRYEDVRGHAFFTSSDAQDSAAPRGPYSIRTAGSHASAGIDAHAGASGADEDTGVCVVGNLPYQIASRIMVECSGASAVSSMVMMMQSEVAERIQASPKTKEYGLLSVLLARRFDVHSVMSVPPHVFFPPPRVHSSVLAFRAHGRYEKVDLKRVASIAKAAFSHRRKKMSRNLKSLGFEYEAICEAMNGCGIAEDARAETLSVDDFVALSHALKQPK